VEYPEFHHIHSDIG